MDKETKLALTEIKTAILELGRKQEQALKSYYDLLNSYAVHCKENENDIGNIKKDIKTLQGIPDKNIDKKIKNIAVYGGILGAIVSVIAIFTFLNGFINKPISRQEWVMMQKNIKNVTNEYYPDEHP